LERKVISMKHAGIFGAVILSGLVLSGLGLPGPAAAQDRAVVGRLVEFGRMPNADARRVARTVSDGLRANADRGGLEYDRIRQAVGRSMFDGPGRTREEFESRLAQVLERMRRGLDEPILEALFPNRENVAVLCANDFAVTMPDCDSLVAAASREPAMLPYTPADSGNAVRDALRQTLPRREAGEVATKLRETMLGIPRTLRRDERGRALLTLLEACPGALTTRESQIRAWHVGPTDGLTRCIAGALVRGRDRSQARELSQMIFGITATQAQAFLDWGAPATAAPVQARPATVSVDQILERARTEFQAGRFDRAAQAYGQATSIDPTNPRAFTGLGSSQLRLGDARSAEASFRTAISINPENANCHALLGSALAALGRRDEASRAFQEALAIQPGHPLAQQGLTQLASAPRTQPRQPVAQPQQPAVSPAESWRTQAREHFRARRFAEAAQAYEAATGIDPSHAGSFAGLGAARLALGDPPGAMRAYQGAVRLAPNNSGYWSAYARAQAQGRDREGALASLERALQIDPQNRAAQEGMRALNSTPAVAQAEPQPAEATQPALPDAPAREEIIRVMQPLQPAIEDCAPTHAGVVRFRIAIEGATGRVRVAILDEDTLDGTPEGTCMVNVVRSATFPTFARDQIDLAYPYELDGTAMP
jgi:tetratricopeptide (TPR) repeat protein